MFCYIHQKLYHAVNSNLGRRPKFGPKTPKFETPIFRFLRTHARRVLMAQSTRLFHTIFNRVNKALLTGRRKSQPCYHLLSGAFHKLSQTPVTTPKLFKIGCFTEITRQLSKQL